MIVLFVAGTEKEKKGSTYKSRGKKKRRGEKATSSTHEKGGDLNQKSKKTGTGGGWVSLCVNCNYQRTFRCELGEGEGKETRLLKRK